MPRHALAASLLASSLLLGCAPAEIGIGEDDDSIGDELRVCADSARTPGVDVSYYQKSIDWPAVRAAGKLFAFIRVSDGADFRDPRWAENWNGAQQAGLYRGAYQFFRASDDPVAQADLLLDALGSTWAGDLPPVLDLEVSDGQRDATVIRKSLVWLERVEAALGRKPIIYTGTGYVAALGNPGALGVYPLWVANWTTRCPSLPPMWSSWAFWQNGVGSTGSVPGIRTPVDLNFFNGSYAELAAYASTPSF